MPDQSFSQPQRQSVLGLILIFATSLYHIGKNLWVIVVYFAVKEVDQQSVLIALGGLSLLLLASLIYSILYYLNFRFHVDLKKEEFILQKGVISTDVINIPFQKIQQVNFRRNILQRILGIYSVVVETAGSQEKEVEIKALSRERADALAECLMYYVAEEELNPDEQPIIEEETSYSDKAAASTSRTLPDWEHKVTLWTLIKLGLTSNYLRGVGVIIAFYFTLREQFRFSEDISAQLEDPQIYLDGGKFLFIAFLLLVGMLITVGETVLKYFGLHIQKFRDTLQVEMGLRNNTKVNLRASRIQLLQVLTNPIQKHMQLYQVKISLASSENDLEKNQLKIVGLPPEVIAQVKSYFYKNNITESFRLLPSKYLLLKRISRGVIPFIIVSGLLFFYARVISLSWFMVITSVYFTVLIVYNYLYLKNLKLGVSKDFLIKYTGVWWKKEEYIEMFRLQAVSVNQPIWYKRRGLVNMTFHSAGGDIGFPLVRQKEARLLGNFLLYRVESTEQPWM